MAAHVDDLLRDRPRLQSIARRTSALAAPDATRRIVDDLLQLQPRRFLSMIAAMINRNATRRRV